MADVRRFHGGTRRVWLALLAAGLILLVAIVAVGFGVNSEGDSSVTASPERAISQKGATPPPSTPYASSPPVSTPSTRPATPAVAPVASPDASTAATPLPPITSGECMDGCLVRLPGSDVVKSTLKTTGERPSYQSGSWLWSIISPETVALLQADDVPVLMVHDSSETLHLYVTRLPDGDPENPLVEQFGEVLDSVDGHSIVRVESVPAEVSAIVGAGIWVEKMMPAAPRNAATTPAGSGESISGIDLGVLLPQVEAVGIERTITELQAMSSTDGTGIGTRHYTTTGNVMACEYLFTRLESYGLNVWYEDFVTPEGLLSTNIVAEIPGRDTGAVYGVMAHLDSTSSSFDSAPGADDNATGLASALEIARILSGYELEHPVHIILVNAEETMILGSMAYAENAVKQQIPLEGVFNVDAVGSDREGPRIILNSDERSAWMMDLLVRMNVDYGLGQDIWVRQNPAIVADDNMLRNEGLEAIMVAREFFGSSTIHHTGDDVMGNVSIPYTVITAQLVLLAIAALVQ